MKKLAENLWLLPYPLKLFGADLRRNVTLIRLASGDLVIHSTGPFEPADVSKIHAAGHPAWIVEAMRHHDTFSRIGRDIFPDIPFLAPPGFSETVNFETLPILPPPPEWADELDALEVGGNKTYGEFVFFHRPSRTLIVADLAFNFSPEEPLWTGLLLHAAIGSEHSPGMSRPFRHAVKDEAAFRASMDAMLAWDFDRVIVGHGDVIETGGHEKIATMLARAGF
ncbi:MAG TPA: hypothetical protein VIM61_01725 [Chthoniobacterales bacterium]|jgi:hypothetical protein